MAASAEAADDPAASTGLPPVAGADARLLILGSLPGRASLRAQQYYAHPRNAFWRIMRSLFGIDGSYRQRCQGLIERKIALWDVLASSVRPGSLDADIRQSTAKANDFERFLVAHGEIALICFNGRKAEALFRGKVLRDLRTPVPELASLPSTSAAHASMPFAGKLAAWRAAVGSR